MRQRQGCQQRHRIHGVQGDCRRARGCGVAAKQAGAHVIEINPEPTDLTGPISDFIIQEKAGVAIPQIIAVIKAMAGDRSR